MRHYQQQIITVDLFQKTIMTELPAQQVSLKWRQFEGIHVNIVGELMGVTYCCNGVIMRHIILDKVSTRNYYTPVNVGGFFHSILPCCPVFFVRDGSI